MRSQLNDEGNTYAGWWLWSAAREQHFRSICDGIPSHISLVSPAGEIQIANRHALQYSGATAEELYGRAITQSVHPDDLADVLAAWGEGIRACRPYSVAARRRRVNGAYRWFEMHGFPLRDVQGRVAYWYLHERDIDDQRRAEALLALEKRFLEMVASGRPMPAILHALCQLIENTVDGCRASVLLVDPTGTHLETGAAPSLPSDYVPSTHGLPVEVTTGPCAMAACLNQQVIVADVASETRWPTWREAALKYNMRACWSTPITTSAGKALGAFAVTYERPGTPTALDLNLVEQLKHIASIAIERTLNDAALRRSEACLAGGQRLSLTGSFIWNVASGQHFWSAETYRIFEYDPSTEVTMQLIVDRVLEDAPQLRRALELAAQGQGFDIECRARMPSGAMKYLHIVAHRARDQEGRLECIGAVRDVTQYRIAEETLGKVRSELAHVSRITTLGEMTASIAHEVNQPITSIVANATTGMRFLSADPPNVAKAREALQRAIDDGSHAADVINGLRALFRKQHATVEPVDVNAAIEEVIALSRSELQNCRVIVRTELAKLAPIYGDRVQLQQVILNLLLNATEAMSDVGDRPKSADDPHRAGYKAISCPRQRAGYRRRGSSRRR